MSYLMKEAISRNERQSEAITASTEVRVVPVLVLQQVQRARLAVVTLDHKGARAQPPGGEQLLDALEPCALWPVRVKLDELVLHWPLSPLSPSV